MTVDELVIPTTQTAPDSNWERIGNWIALLLYSAVVLFTVHFHEKWADEAQAWLLARDLSLKTLWFHELRYEGSPGLWHTILWVAQRVFHASYNSMSYIGVAFAIVGVSLLIFTAPFPFYVRWPLAFTYVLLYQYAVIARPYCLFPLLCFMAALLFDDHEHPQRMTVVLLLLSLLSVHGIIMAVCLGMLYLTSAKRKWSGFTLDLRRRYWICLTIMALIYLFLCIVLWPTSDVAEFAPTNDWVRMFPQPTHYQKLISIISGALFDYPVPSLLFLVLAGAWCFTRRKLMIFALPVLLLIGLYIFIHGYAHHHGTVFVAVITALWIAWPDTIESKVFDDHSRWMLHGMVVLLLCLCALNIWDSAVVIKREYLYPYSGARDAAAYLQKANPGNEPVMGYLFGIVALQPYFSHNIFANMPTAFYHQGLPLAATSLDVSELRRISPELVVAYSTDPQLMANTDGPMWRSLGYEMVHFSDGYYLYKRVVYQRESYLIYRRIHTTDGQTQRPAGLGKQAENGNRR